jgi:hypothetical protein
MRRYLIHVAALASLAAALACGQSLPAERPRLGYSADAFARQHEVERRYQESVTSAALSNSHRRHGRTLRVLRAVATSPSRCGRC